MFSSSLLMATMAESDPHINNVSLLLHFAGNNNSTSIADSSPTPKTCTAFGNARISTAQSRFGGSSLFTDGADDYVRITHNASTAFSYPGDYTIEGWCYNLTATDFLGIYTNNMNGEWSQQGGGLLIQSNRYEMTGTAGSVSYANGIIPQNTWTYWCNCRSGSTVFMFIGENLSSTRTNSNTIGNANTIPGIGVFDSYQNTPRLFFNGYHDEIRITKGICRYQVGSGNNLNKIVFRGTNILALPTQRFPDV